MAENGDDLRRIYEEIIKLSATVNRIEGRLDGYVTHEKHAEDAVKRDRRVFKDLMERIDDAHERINGVYDSFTERAKILFKAEIPTYVDQKNEHDMRIIRRAQILGLTGAGTGLIGIVLWLLRSVGS